jgi:asparagine synthase (glutamine-hydrolysing)
MLSTDGDVGVVFNGAIYNFRQLRSELAAAGYSFRSDTDTEVLVHGYRAWGIDRLVERLDGMFAFAIWDRRAEVLYLVRDRLGVKPLVYTPCRNGGLAFASTVRALRVAGIVSEVAPLGVLDFLHDGFVSESRSIYEGARKLPPASIMEWHNGSSQIRRYWTPPMPRAEGAVSFDSAVDEAERLLLREVEARLHADVPVAALLSAGIDSSLVCWAVAKLGGDVTAFTFSTPGYPSDESAAAIHTAELLGIRHELLPLSDADEPEVSDLVAAYPEPFACSSALGMLQLSKAISRTSARVFLTGDGGDDVFLGYPRHRLLLRTQRIAAYLPSPATDLWRGTRQFMPRRGVVKRAVHFVDYAMGGLGAFLDASPGAEEFRARSLFGPRLLDLPLRHHTWSIQSARRALAEYLEHDMATQFVSEYLVKVDGASMYFGLEARSPFLGRSLWEFASALPFEVRLRGGVLKAVLRELARRRLGARVADAPKRGFTVPVETWMGRRWLGRVREAMQDSLLVSEGWVSKAGTQAELALAEHSRRASRRLWYLWVLEEWLRLEREGVTSAVPDGHHPGRRMGLAS